MWNRIIKNLGIVDEPYGFVPMDTFTKRYQHLHDKAEYWMEYGAFSVIVELYDGTTYLYDDMENRLRRIKLFDDSSELSETEWRSGFAYFLGKEIWSSGMHKYEIAETAGISNVQLSRYLNKKITPSAYIIQRLSDAVGCGIYAILPHDFIPVD